MLPLSLMFVAETWDPIAGVAVGIAATAVYALLRGKRRANGIDVTGSGDGPALAVGEGRPAIRLVARLSAMLGATADPERDGALAHALALVADALDVRDVTVRDTGSEITDEMRVISGHVEVPLRASGVGGCAFGVLALTVSRDEQATWLLRHESVLHVIADLVAGAIARSRLARQLAHQALVEETMFDALGGPAALIDRAGTIVRANATWRGAGIALPAVGGDYLALMAGGPADAVAAVLDGTSAGLDTEVGTDGGGGIEVVVAPLGSDGMRGGGALVVHRDVSAQRRAAADAQHNRDEAAHMARVIAAGALASSFAHELNQPLTAMRTNAQAALRLLVNQPPDVIEIRDILNDIASDAKRAGEVIQRLRGLIKHDEPHLELLDFNDVVEGAVRLMSTEAHIKRVAIVVETDPVLPLVHGDRVQLQQVVLNLLINACEAMDERAGVGRGLSNVSNRRLTLQTAAVSSGELELTVHDTGPGIPPDALDRVFAPFYSTKRHGLGVGLSITRSIVEAHGGRISASNDPGGGAIFRLRMPVAVTDEHAAVAAGAGTLAAFAR